MSVLVTLIWAFAFLALLLLLPKFAPDFLSRIGGAPGLGADSAAGGSYGEGHDGGDD